MIIENKSYLHQEDLCYFVERLERCVRHLRTYERKGMSMVHDTHTVVVRVPGQTLSSEGKPSHLGMRWNLEWNDGRIEINLPRPEAFWDPVEAVAQLSMEGPQVPTTVVEEIAAAYLWSRLDDFNHYASMGGFNHASSESGKLYVQAMITPSSKLRISGDKNVR